MTRISRTALRAAAIAALLLGLGACSDAVDKAGQVDKAVDAVDRAVNATYAVTYEVTGRNIDTIEFHAGGGSATDPRIEQVRQPTLPWKKTITLRGIMPPAVIPVALDPEGVEVSCRIIYKGEVIKEAKGAGAVTGGGCIAVSPLVE